MTIIAREGYADATMAAVAGEARVSLATLYANFADKADVFAAALLRNRLRMVAATVPAYARGGTWAESISALLRASLAFLESEPDFARLVVVDVPSAGGAALEARDRALESTRAFLQDGLAGSGIEGPVAVELIQSIVYGLLAARVRSRRSANLTGLAPLGIYVILAPVLGAEEAYRHAAARR